MSSKSTSRSKKTKRKIKLITNTKEEESKNCVTQNMESILNKKGRNTLYFKFSKVNESAQTLKETPKFFPLITNSRNTKTENNSIDSERGVRKYPSAGVRSPRDTDNKEKPKIKSIKLNTGKVLNIKIKRIFEDIPQKILNEPDVKDKVGKLMNNIKEVENFLKIKKREQEIKDNIPAGRIGLYHSFKTGLGSYKSTANIRERTFNINQLSNCPSKVSPIKLQKNLSKYKVIYKNEDMLLNRNENSKAELPKTKINNILGIKKIPHGLSLKIPKYKKIPK